MTAADRTRATGLGHRAGRGGAIAPAPDGRVGVEKAGIREVRAGENVRVHLDRACRPADGPHRGRDVAHSRDGGESLEPVSEENQGAGGRPAGTPRGAARPSKGRVLSNPAFGSTELSAARWRLARSFATEGPGMLWTSRSGQHS